MFQTRIHGRGGQGVVTASELLSVAAFDAGRHAQSFPSFGSERTGAPVVAYCRIDDAPIRSREPIQVPDALIIQDATLLHQIDLFSGIPDHCYIIINSRKSRSELGIDDVIDRLHADRIVTVPATDLAREYIGKPVPNAILLGGFAALTNIISLEGLQTALCHKFPGPMGEANCAGAQAAYEFVQRAMSDASPVVTTESETV